MVQKASRKNKTSTLYIFSSFLAGFHNKVVRGSYVTFYCSVALPFGIDITKILSCNIYSRRNNSKSFVCIAFDSTILHIFVFLLLFSQLLVQFINFFIRQWLGVTIKTFSDIHGIKVVMTTFFCYFCKRGQSVFLMEVIGGKFIINLE